MRDAFTIKTACDASVVRKSALGDDLALKGRYDIECVGPDRETEWRNTIDNLAARAGARAGTRGRQPGKASREDVSPKRCR
jgi:hypothetical protein